MLQHKCKDVGVNMEDELVKMFNLTLKMRETILFFLIMIINELTWIVSDIGLAILHLLGCPILGETSQRRSALVTKFSQPRAWISLKRASAAP